MGTFFFGLLALPWLVTLIMAFAGAPTVFRLFRVFERCEYVSAAWFTQRPRLWPVRLCWLCLIVAAGVLLAVLVLAEIYVAGPEAADAEYDRPAPSRQAVARAMRWKALRRARFVQDASSADRKGVS